MNNVHPLFVAALLPFSPAPVLIEAEEETNDEPPLFGDDREDIGYEMQRQSRIDMQPDGKFQFNLKEPTC